jgi:hypothetical protein
LTAFRCADASLARAEPLIGTASTARAFLLVEFAGAWGRDALRDSRLSARVRRHLAESSRRLSFKPLLVRRHGRSTRTGGPQVFAAYAGAGASWTETATLRSADDLLGIDLDPLVRGESLGLARHDQPLVLVCTHGRHDPCCAERGRPLAALLSKSHPDLVWEASHIGGDRFAANLLILPGGVYYGRVELDRAEELVRGHLAGRVDLDHLRGRSSHPFAVQAAEWHLRSRLGESRLDAVRLVRHRRDGDVWEADFEVAAQVWRVIVRAGRAVAELLTCAAERPGHAPSFELVDVIEIHRG